MASKNLLVFVMYSSVLVGGPETWAVVAAVLRSCCGCLLANMSVEVPSCMVVAHSVMLVLPPVTCFVPPIGGGGGGAK